MLHVIEMKNAISKLSIFITCNMHLVYMHMHLDKYASAPNTILTLNRLLSISILLFIMLSLPKLPTTNKSVPIIFKTPSPFYSTSSLDKKKRINVKLSSQRTGKTRQKNRLAGKERKLGEELGTACN